MISYYLLRIALRFRVWLASLSSRFAVNTETCSSSLLQACYAMTLGLFYSKGRGQLPSKISSADFLLRIALRFRVWLASLSSRLAVNTTTCSSSLLQACYNMTMGFYRARVRTLSPPFCHRSSILFGNCKVFPFMVRI